MMIVNVPNAIAWFMMYNASSVVEIFIANALLGFGLGLMEAPIMTYVGEICEPSLRGVLITYTNLGTSMGVSLVYLLNTVLAWRMVGLICMFVPITTLVALYFVSFRRFFLPLVCIRFSRNMIFLETTNTPITYLTQIYQIIFAFRIFRFQRRHIGYFQRAEVIRPKKVFAGSEVGCQRRW